MIKMPSQAIPALHWCLAVQVFFDTVSKQICELSDILWSQQHYQRKTVDFETIEGEKRSCHLRSRKGAMW